MIRIKNYIFNEKEIVSIEPISDGLRVDLKSKSDYIDIYATVDDIEWNYGNNISESLSYDLAKARIEELEEKNKKLKKDLEIEINSSNLKSSRIETKDIIIKKLQSAKDKTINYVNQKLNADDPVLVEFEMETIIDLLEGE
jgi:hypothetical protein